MTKPKNKITIAKVYRFFIYILPAVLFFSYYPLIHFGATKSMNLEISLPLIWLVIFDLFSLGLLIKHQKLSQIPKKWPWLLFPIFATLSVLWSVNFLRGLLTIGIIWLLYLAIFSFHSFKNYFSVKTFTKNLLSSLFISTLIICAWCYLQCILDLAGITQNLMCAGCTYKMFGFPHPNGFAAEPQFMGNLLLAPAILAGYFALKNKKYFILFFIFASTLFLTLSRGAIYSFIIAMIFVTVAEIIRTKKWHIMLAWPIIILSFLFTLNLQGIFAQVSETNDTYTSGVSKAVNQLTLGTIKLEERPQKAASKKPAHFEGYVEVSTDMRLNLSKEALSIWSENWHNALFGVGLGGTSNALSMRNITKTPEIVNNQYITILLETGIIGLALIVFTLILVFKAVIKNPLWLPITTIIVAYLISLFFFSGLPNALHIYLLPAILLYGKTPYHK